MANKQIALGIPTSVIILIIQVVVLILEQLLAADLVITAALIVSIAINALTFIMNAVYVDPNAPKAKKVIG